jgi:HAD superfamily hydrolase (TIGR01450 family)
LSASPEPATRFGPIARSFSGYAFDLDGTLYVDDSLLPWAAQTITRIRAGGGRVAFVTNKPLETASDYATKLTTLGVPVDPGEVVTSIDALVLYMERHHPRARVMPIAEPVVFAALTEAGFRVTDDPAETDVVVVAFDRTFNYAKLTAAYRAVRLHEAALVATNPDPYCPTSDGGIPDCAAMLAAVEACTGAKAEAIVGKPSQYMAEAVLKRLNVAAGSTAMVGDRLATDVAMARSFGLVAVLVLTGASTIDDISPSPFKPDYAIDGLHELLPAGYKAPQSNL